MFPLTSEPLLCDSEGKEGSVNTCACCTLLCCQCIQLCNKLFLKYYFNFYCKKDIIWSNAGSHPHYEL